MHNPAEGYFQTVHPVQGLPRVVRHITANDAQDNSVFLSTDVGDHHRELVNKSAIANILYSTNQVPVDLNGDLDVKYAQQNDVSDFSNNRDPGSRNERLISRTKHSPASRSKTELCVAWWISYLVAWSLCIEKTVWI